MHPPARVLTYRAYTQVIPTCTKANPFRTSPSDRHVRLGQCMLLSAGWYKPLARQEQLRPKRQKLESGSTEPFRQRRTRLLSRRTECSRPGMALFTPAPET